MIVILAALALGAPVVAATDPLAPAREGKQLCIDPNVAARSCAGITAYAFGVGGSASSESRVIFSATPLIIATMRAPVTMKDGRECSSTDDFPDQIVGLEMDGEALSGDTLALVSEILVEHLAATVGSGEICSAHGPVRADGSVDFTVTVDGAARPDMNGAALWIEPDANWRVAL